ncbi:MAG TPA: hypothetical protein VF691_12140 [Cytophagaceae bacterium]|jgi:ribosomal protein S15P/S13E
MKILEQNVNSEDAKELLLEIIQCTVNFYNVKNLRSHMQIGSPDVESMNILKQLVETRNELLKVLDEPTMKEGINNPLPSIKIYFDSTLTTV